MEKQVYITEEERVKCQKVADAFAELYEIENIVVIDAGRYGFVELKYYKSPHGLAAFAATGIMRLSEQEMMTLINQAGANFLLQAGVPLEKISRRYEGDCHE